MKDELIYRYLDKNFWVNEKNIIIYKQTNEEAWTILNELIKVFNVDYREAIQIRDEWRLNYEKTNP